MKTRRYRVTVCCLLLIMLVAICSACSTAKPETTQAAVSSTVEEAPAQKAIARYGELLKSHPTILHSDVDALDDLSFGYDENMAKFGEHYDYFAILDLNHDGIPELIAVTVINNGWMPVSLFRFDEQNSALELLKDPLDPEAHATLEHMSTAGGTYGFYLCREDHLHSNWGGDTPIGFQEENHAYVLTPEGLTAVDCPISNHTGNTADIALSLWDVLKMNDEETRNAVFETLK